MTDTRRNLMVGVFVLVGILALGALVVLFGQGPRWLIRGDTYALNIRFDSAAGIRSGTLVTVLGKRIGHVRTVEFVNPDDLSGGVNVVVAIDQEFRIPDDSLAETFEAGLLAGGRPPIRIIPGHSATHLPPDKGVMVGLTKDAMSAVLPEEISSNLDRTARQIGEAAAAMRPVLEAMEKMLAPRDPHEVDTLEGATGNLASAAARLDALLAHFNEILGDPEQKSRLKETIANAYSMSEDGRILMADLRQAAGDVKTAAEKAGGVMTKMESSLDNVDQRVADVSHVLIDDLNEAGDVLRYLKQAAALMSEGDGSVAKALRDDRLYESMVLTSRRLEETIEEVRLLVKDWQKGKIRVAFN